MSLSSVLDQVEALAQQAAQATMTVYHDNFDVEYKRDDRESPLTEADEKAHRIITAGLEEITPDIPVISEEASTNRDFERRQHFERFWLVDPLDGTREFVNKNGEFTTNIGLIDHGLPVAGIVVAPVPELVYRAGNGEAVVRRDGETHNLSTSRENDLHKATLVHSRSHPSDRLSKLLDHTDFGQTLERGSSLKICMVAEGSADIYCRFGPTWEWDTAAADALLRLAGGKFTEIDGSPQIYNKPSLKNERGFLVTNELLHEAAVDAIQAIQDNESEVEV